MSASLHSKVFFYPFFEIGFISSLSYLGWQRDPCSHEVATRGCGAGNSVGYLSALGLEKVPSCFVFTSFSWYSMCMTSVFFMLEFSRNSSRILGRKPGLSWPARRNWRYRDNTCFCSLLWRAMVWNTGQQQHRRQGRMTDRRIKQSHR
uniref:Uncharacterized protein n=1 Tax=Hucho hucho TaxID=62062 RepID=A0A4W5LRE4_9TELE